MDILEFLNQVLCRPGFHDYQVGDAIFGFSDGTNVERNQCRHCGKICKRQHLAERQKP